MSAGLRPPKSIACTTQIYRLPGLHPPNLQAIQACTYPNLQTVQAYTYLRLYWPALTQIYKLYRPAPTQIYSLGRPAPTQVYSLHHPNLQAVRPVSTKSTAWAGLCPSKSTVCTTQIYRLSGLHPPNLQL